MITCLAIGATVLAMIALVCVPASFVAFMTCKQSQNISALSTVALMIALASLACGSAVWLWQKALAS